MKRRWLDRGLARVLIGGLPTSGHTALRGQSRKGLLFERACTQQALCAPSGATLFSELRSDAIREAGASRRFSPSPVGCVPAGLDRSGVTERTIVVLRGTAASRASAGRGRSGGQPSRGAAGERLVGRASRGRESWGVEHWRLRGKEGCGPGSRRLFWKPRTTSIAQNRYESVLGPCENLPGAAGSRTKPGVQLPIRGRDPGITWVPVAPWAYSDARRSGGGATTRRFFPRTGGVEVGHEVCVRRLCPTPAGLPGRRTGFPAPRMARRALRCWERAWSARTRSGAPARGTGRRLIADQPFDTPLCSHGSSRLPHAHDRKGAAGHRRCHRKTGKFATFALDGRWTGPLVGQGRKRRRVPRRAGPPARSKPALPELAQAISRGFQRGRSTLPPEEVGCPLPRSRGRCASEPSARGRPVAPYIF